MDYSTATQQAINDIATLAEGDNDPVRAGLQLAIYAWQTCQPHPATAGKWAMFGNGLSAAVDELDQPPYAYVIVLDDPAVPDTAQVRHQTVALTTALAEHLEAASGDPRHAPRQRWAWATAAARLRTAAHDLVHWP